MADPNFLPTFSLDLLLLISSLFSRTPMTIINIFTKADSVAALIWASALACVVAMVMLLVPRTLTLQEYMEVTCENG